LWSQVRPETPNVLAARKDIDPKFEVSWPESKFEPLPEKASPAGSPLEALRGALKQVERFEQVTGP
jgi:hypothetical protein